MHEPGWKTLQGECHSAAGWGISGSVEVLLWIQSPFVRAMGCRYLRCVA